jgi:UDP-glucuronate 4-epimerase
MAILVTGAAGFIGYHLTKQLLSEGYSVVGIDNINTYYDIELKQSRLAEISKFLNNSSCAARDVHFNFFELDICNKDALRMLFMHHNFSRVYHLAAQAGVRYSLENPLLYQKVNGEGFLNVLELAREFDVAKFVYASSSSVYGNNPAPLSAEHHDVDSPVSLYAATKRSNELVAHVYNSLYHMTCVGLRFFTVYGPWGRPDMATFIFTKSILEGKPIKLFNNGKMRRSFTYIDDIIDGIMITCQRRQEDVMSHLIMNIGNDESVELERMVKILEGLLNKKAIIQYEPIQRGDVVNTAADITDARSLGFNPKVNIETGLRKFVQWYMSYYHILSNQRL